VSAAPPPSPTVRSGEHELHPWPRAWLFTPADDRRRLDSGVRCGAEAVIADLEDAVAEERKDVARGQALGFLATRDERPLRVVRVNDPCTERGRIDLECLGGRAPAAVMVPKACLATIALARAAGVPVIALVETAQGVSELEAIAALDGVLAIALGTVDLSAELGLGELPDGLELLHVRSRLVLACALGGIPAIDGVYLNVTDMGGLADEARRARALGFAAKLCIHPAQLEIVRDAFTPSAAELERARRVVEAYERSLGGQRGAGLADGQMVDLATVRRARRVLGGADPGAPEGRLTSPRLHP
jgi:citrate lyase subunit beta/citryl-CoA lyase